MTKKEKKDIALCVRCIMMDSQLKPYTDDYNRKYTHLLIDKTLIDLYKKVYGSAKGFRSYIRTQCVSFWSDGFEPYLDKNYLDMATIINDGRIINYDDLWCYIRDCLAEDYENETKGE